MVSRTERRARWLAPALLAIGIAGCAAAWVLVAVGTGGQASWMALLAGLDAALLLRFAGTPRSPARMLVALAATFATIALASWGIAATQVGRSVGVLPWASIVKLGPEFAWTLLALANTAADWAWLAAGMVVAAVASR